MSGTYIEELGDIYGANIISENKQEELEQDTSALAHSGPEAAEGFEAPKADSKIDDAGHVEKLSNPVTKKEEKKVKKESSDINNSTMKDINKSTFDRLFEDVMGAPDMDLDAHDDEMDLGMDDLGGEDEGGDVTLTLTADQVSVLKDVLGQLDGGDDLDGDVEDIEDIEDVDELDELENAESHVELHNAPDSVGTLTGQNNKVALAADGGSASTDAGGEENGGKPVAAKDGTGALQGKNNKVADLKGNAFSK